MNRYNYIVFEVQSYLNVEDLLLMQFVSKHFKRNIPVIRERVDILTKSVLHKFYIIIKTPKVVRLNTQPTEILNEIPLIRNIINNNNIYKSSIIHLLNNCDHIDKSKNTSMCNICKTILQVYNTHISGIRTFSNYQLVDSFIMSVIIQLYS